MASTPPIPPEDTALFREAVADATPVRAATRREPDPPRLKPVPAQTLMDERQALRDALAAPDMLSDAYDIGEAQTFIRDGLPRQVLRNLRSGRWVVQDELDLHGLRVEEARVALVTFLQHCLREGVRCVRIIHGKGSRSEGGEAVLRGKVRGWLMQRDEILAYSEPPAAGGGSGAVLVLIKAG